MEKPWKLGKAWDTNDNYFYKNSTRTSANGWKYMNLILVYAAKLLNGHQSKNDCSLFILPCQTRDI